MMMMYTLLRITLLTVQEHDDDDDVYFVKDNKVTNVSYYTLTCTGLSYLRLSAILKNGTNSTGIKNKECECYGVLSKTLHMADQD